MKVGAAQLCETRVTKLAGVYVCRYLYVFLPACLCMCVLCVFVCVLASVCVSAFFCPLGLLSASISLSASVCLSALVHLSALVCIHLPVCHPALLPVSLSQCILILYCLLARLYFSVFSPPDLTLPLRYIDFTVVFLFSCLWHFLVL